MAVALRSAQTPATDLALDVAALARVVKLAEAHFRQVFRADMGLVPETFLVEQKLDLTRSLLLVSEPNCAQVAESCGFFIGHMFSKVFRWEIGQSPKRWARQMQDAGRP